MRAALLVDAAEWLPKIPVISIEVIKRVQVIKKANELNLMDCNRMIGL